MKYCFVSDYDCHNYLIPFNLKSEFESLRDESDENEDYSKFNDLFSKYMINGIEGYYFEEPELIEVDK